MTIDGNFLFLGLIALAAFFTWFSFVRPNILISMATGFIWFALFMWLFFGTSPPIGISEGWMQILTWVFLMLTFVPFLAHMDVEITNEAEGKRWKSYGQPPKGESISRAEEYRKILRRRR